MKHISVALFISCLFFSIPLIAQQNHFIYIQTENKQAFYVKLDKKVFSSSVTGYVVVPKLKSGDYIFTIGFVKNEWPDQVFHCVVADKDLGYLLKNFGDKGWGFFNLQTLQVLMADNHQSQPAIAATDEKADAFSTLLSNVVNDPTIKQKDPVKPPVKETQKPAVVAADIPVVTIAATGIVKPSIIKTISPVIKKQTRKTTEGVETVYLDTVNGKLDTITIFTVEDKVVAIEPTATLRDTPAVSTVNTVVNTPKQPAKFLEMELPNAIAPTGGQWDTGAKLSTTKSPMMNSDCKNFATNEDFMKLRKKMAAAENAENMIGLAKKVFKTKCFTTEQVKNLSVLFLKDASKYDFFDSAYPFVSDSQNYATLESQLTDSYYISRFKVMIRH